VQLWSRAAGGVPTYTTVTQAFARARGGSEERMAHMPAERVAECARRAVADAFGDFGEPDVVAAEQVLRNRHAPGEQIFDPRCG
jgi:hypothetical protein